jgi:hypothetical protein
MAWFKAAAIVACLIIVYLVINTIVWALSLMAIGALIIGGVIAAIKFHNRQLLGNRSDRELRQPRYSNPSRRATPNVDDELTRLKREMGH